MLVCLASITTETEGSSQLSYISREENNVTWTTGSLGSWVDSECVSTELHYLFLEDQGLYKAY